MTMTEQQNGARSKSLTPSNNLGDETNRNTHAQGTAQTARLVSDSYCGCPRTGDLWRCPVGGTSECAPGGGCCALYATTLATGRETWDRAAEDALDSRPCPCEDEIRFPLRDYPMRKPCVHCGGTLGVLNRKNGQDVVRCQDCDRYQYCAPRSETGLPEVLG